MPTTITIKNIQPDLYELLKKHAADHHRSINNDVIAIIEEKLRGKRLNPEEFLVAARNLRERTKAFTLTDEFISRAKNEGRP